MLNEKRPCSNFDEREASLIIFVAVAELTHKDQRSSEQHCIGRFLEVEENMAWPG